MGSLTKPILLAVIGILAVVLFLQTSNLITGNLIGNNTSQAEIPTKVTTENVPPTVYNVNFTMVRTPEASCGDDTTKVWCWGIVNDSNGWENVSLVNASLWQMGVTGGEDCAVNRSNCYRNASCNDNSSIDVAQRTYNCSFSVLPFYAENGTWNCTMWAYDQNATSWNDTEVSLDSANRIRDPYYALSINDSINWGSAAIGSIKQQTVNVSNCGNRLMDTKVNGSNMNCTLNYIVVSNITYDTTAAAATALSTVSTKLNTNHAVPVDGNSDVMVLTYWNLSVPANVGGSCIGNATFIAVENAP